MNITKKILGVAGIAVVALMPLLAAAQTNPSFVQQSGDPIQQLINILKQIANYFLTAVFIIAGFMIIYAGWTYLTAGGDPDKVGTAKNTIIYAVIGIGVALLSQLIVAIAGAIVGGR